MDTSTVGSEVPSSAAFHPWYTGVMVFGLMLLTAGIPGNLLTTVVYLKIKQLHNPTNLLIFNQSIGDLFTCLFGSLFAVLHYTEAGIMLMSSNKYVCLITLAFTCIALQSSITSLLALSTERFIAVYCPFNYYDWVTDVNVKRSVGIMWTVIFMANALPIFDNKWIPGETCTTTSVYKPGLLRFIFAFPYMICVAVLTLENLLICAMAVRKRRSVVPSPPVNHTREHEESEARRKSQFKVTKMLLLVVGVFYLSWCPSIVFNSLFFYKPRSWELYGIPQEILVMHECSKAFLVINTIANPFIYGYKNIHFRKAYFKLLGLRKSRLKPADMRVVEMD